MAMNDKLLAAAKCMYDIEKLRSMFEQDWKLIPILFLSCDKIQHIK